jgi:hypothetical protein
MILEVSQKKAESELILPFLIFRDRFGRSFNYPVKVYNFSQLKIYEFTPYLLIFIRTDTRPFANSDAAIPALQWLSTLILLSSFRSAVTKVI